MGAIMAEGGAGRLEGSCGPAPGNWMREAPGGDGVERIEAYFRGHAYDPHRHDTYAIGFTISGVQCFDYRGARADSVAGNAIVLHPDEVHDGRSGAEEGFRYRMIYVAPRKIAEALGARAAGLPFVRGAVTRDPRLVAAVRRAIADIDRPLESLEADQAMLAIAEALRALDPSVARASRSGASNVRAIERACGYLDGHFREAVGSQALEAVSGLDRFTLARQFRRRLGTSPYRYLTMRRLDHARAAIRAGDSLADAAASSGFADQSHMTRQFRRAYGISPGRWRSIQRGGEDLEHAGVGRN